MKKFVLIGAPDDRGVAINKGRPGAAEGPDAVRKELFPNDLIQDGGDIPIAPTQDATYQSLVEKVFQTMEAKAFPIVVGGGHDMSYGSLTGFFKKYPGGGLINIDPHLDCRPTLTPGEYSSGTAFRRLLEEKKISGKSFIEFGYKPEKVIPEHLQFLQERHVTTLDWKECRADPAKNFRNALEKLSASCLAVAVTFDCDAIDQEYAPGVSAANTDGLTPQEAQAIIQIAAGNEKVKYLDLMEVNPRFDPDRRTIRLAALLLSLFCTTRSHP